MDFTKDPSIRKAIMIIYYFAFHYGQKRKKKPQAKPKRNETSKVLTEQWKIVKNELRGSGAVQVKKKTNNRSDGEPFRDSIYSN